MPAEVQVFDEDSELLALRQILDQKLQALQPHL
jgi:hypothetical protein